LGTITASFASLFRRFAGTPKGAGHASTSIAATKSAIGSGSALEDSGGAVRVGIVHYDTADEVDRLPSIEAANCGLFGS
jgi:hypothetical protein